MNRPDDAAARDHIFISYASEDQALARWLALRLTAEGYKVWIDCFKLLGGEPFPEDIDRALKQRTFRLLGLLSQNSIRKDDPSGERTMAINLGRARDENFLIPLNVDGLTPTGLDWRTSRLTFIPFSESWAVGLAQLLKKLEEEGAPKHAGDGRQIAASAYLSDDVLSGKPERVYANLLRFKRIPKVLSCYQPRWALSATDRNTLANHWAFWAQPGRVGAGQYFAFCPPPQAVAGFDRLSWKLLQSGRWRDLNSFRDMYPEHIVKPLLRRTILHHLRRRGLKPVSTRQSTVLYFPRGLLKNDSLAFTMPGGRSTYRRVVGERSYPGSGDTYRYHQAVTIDVLRDLTPRFVIKFRIKLHITRPGGERLGQHSANARRKHLTRDWYNDEWLARHFAICAFMSDDDGTIVIGEDDPVVLSGSLVSFEAPQGINEEAVPKGTPRYLWASEHGENGQGNDDQLEDADVVA